MDHVTTTGISKVIFKGHCWNVHNYVVVTVQSRTSCISNHILDLCVVVHFGGLAEIKGGGQFTSLSLPCFIYATVVTHSRILLHTSFVLRRNMTKDYVDYQDHLSYLSLQRAHYTTTLTTHCVETTLSLIYRAVSYDIHSSGP